jgi:hypothetical protein
MMKTKFKNLDIKNFLVKVFPFIVAIIFATTAITSVSDKSASTDEKYHLTRGIMLIETGDMRLNQHHPYLFNAILALPTLFDTDLVTPSLDQEKWIKADKDGLSSQLVKINGGTEEFSQNVLAGPRILMITISTVFLVLFYYLLKSRFGGFIATVSLLLLATSPTYFAHSRLVTTDIPAAITIFLSSLALYDYFKAEKNERFKKLSIFIFAYFIALLSKYSAVTIVAVYAPLIIIDEFTRKEDWKGFAIELIKKGSLIIFSLLFLLTAAYKFQFATIQDMQYGNETKILYAYNDINRIRDFGLVKIADGLEFVYEKARLPFPQFVHGFYENVINHNLFGHKSFFLGEREIYGWRTYFPVSYMLKENLFTVAVSAFSLVIGAWSLIKNTIKQKKWTKQLSLSTLALLLTPSLLLFLSINSSLNLGIRYLLPIYPFIFLGIAIIFSLIYNKWKKAVTILFVIGAFLNIISIGTNYPDYISYFNESVAPENRHLYLRDSSFDWHQNDVQIRNIVEENEHIHGDIEKAKPNEYLVLSYSKFWGRPESSTEAQSWLLGEFYKGNIEVVEYDIPVTHIMFFMHENPYYESE